jgi:hypothetical protein
MNRPYALYVNGLLRIRTKTEWKAKRIAETRFKGMAYEVKKEVLC